ncbi:MAG TPA: DUF898 family protein [Patescibacteria group bacterium]|nr:DUF898 family protein [Patescibacteria group bacterium]
MAHGKFEFKGDGISFLWLCIWTGFLCFITIGIYSPWAYCEIEKWKAKNTYIDGKQLVFKGTGGGIFGTWLLIFFLSFITLGIYMPWGMCRIIRWKTNNLYYADTGDVEKN